MRSTVIPAQITTVEDKIAGNFNLSQILLLMTPVIMASILYSLIPTQMSFGKGKIIVTLLSTFIAVTLAIRVKNKIVLEWLTIWLKFSSRPNFYIFNKNDNYLREVEVVKKKKVKRVVAVKAETQEKIRMSEGDEIKWQTIISKNKSLAFEFNPKGALHVAMERR